MDELNSQIRQPQWPSRGWIVFVQLTFIGWSLLTGGLVAATLGSLAMQLLRGQAIHWLSYPLLGWALVAVVVWLYWAHRWKGARPGKVAGQPFMAYLDVATMRLMWRALGLMRRAGQTTLNIGQLFSAVELSRGTRMTVARLDWQNGATLQIEGSTEDANPILVRAFELATAEGSQLNWSHLLKAIIEKSSVVKNILQGQKVTLDESLAVVEWSKQTIGYRAPQLRHGLLYDLLGPRRNLNKTWTARPTPILDRFSQNLTDLARVGLLTSARVREKEVEESVRALSRGEQNSVILVGEPGVGKTSIIGDIALRMIRGDIPALSDHKLVSLDIGTMIGAGAGFQQLFAAAVNEAAASGNTILFIGNLDQLGKARSGAGFDVSAILLGALEKKMQLVGTSDPVNYKKYIENNSNLVRLFSRVNVEELSPDRAILVLEDLSYKIEARQGVLITLAAVKAAVELASKYLHERKLPDKALDLLDEAAVYASRSHRAVVGRDEVEQVMSLRTNVPIGEITQTEKDKLSGLEEKIHGRLVGQDEAVTAVVEALKRARLGVAAAGKRPIGNFLFLGPTGVGKTELAKSLAWAYFGDETKIIRLDMNEYQTRDSIYRILGAPAVSGDVSLSGGSFTEAVKKSPFAVVLLDEIEKAHPEILDVFLRVLDEGKLTDNLGNTIDFTNTIIIATSNAQARVITDAVQRGVPYNELCNQLSKLLIQETFKPEFVNRFDGVIVFKPLTPEQIEQIAKIKVVKLAERLRADKGIELTVTDSAIKRLARLGYDPAFGARPLERTIRDKVETRIANEVLKNSDVKQITIDEGDL
jgi:ATP-dependent Clp protease ATP-binding subunit ClpC